MTLEGVGSGILKPRPTRLQRVRKDERNGRRAFLKAGIPDGEYGVIKKRIEGIRHVLMTLPPKKIFWVTSGKGYLKAIRVGEGGPVMRFDRVGGAERAEPLPVDPA